MQGPCWIFLRVFKFCLAKVVLFNHTCILDSLHCFHHSDTFAIYINLQSTSHWIILHPTPPTTFWGIMLSCSVISRVLYSKQDFAHIWTTRSCAALRAADLGLSGQDAFAQWHSFDPKNVTWQTQGPTEWEIDHFTLPTRGHNWPFRCLDSCKKHTNVWMFFAR